MKTIMKQLVGHKFLLKIYYRKYDILGGDYPPPKPVKLSRIMSHSRITGVFSHLPLKQM